MDLQSPKLPGYVHRKILPFGAPLICNTSRLINMFYICYCVPPRQWPLPFAANCLSLVVMADAS